jgi:hypothetical protein
MEHIRPQGRPYPAGENGLDRSCGFALPDGSSDAYNEEAFQYFLEIERKRSEISNRPFLLMLIEYSRQTGVTSDIDGVTARRLFALLRECLRETDFIGWYRERRIAGAVLTQDSGSNRADLSEVVRKRVGEALNKLFPPNRTKGFEVRIYELSPSSSSGVNRG